MNTRPERVKEAAELAERNRSVAEVAEACGVTRQAAYNWRKGDNTKLTGEALVELAELSGLNARWIINGKGPKYALSADERDLLHGFALSGEERRRDWLLIARAEIAAEAARRKLAS